MTDSGEKPLTTTSVEDLLRESEAKFNNVFMASPAGIIIVRLADRKFVEVNDAIVQMTGYTREELIGRTSVEIGLIVDFDERSRLLRQMEHQGALNHVEVKLRHKSGQIIHIIHSAHTTRIRGEPHVVTLAYDITIQKMAEETVRNLNRELANTVRNLEAANTELEAFTYTVSHDLRAPIRAIRGFADILHDACKETLDARSTRTIEVIKASAARMETLIDDLLAFSRSGKKTMQKTDVQVNAMVKAAVQEAQGTAGNTQAEIRILTMLPCRGDTELLHQVFVNLISNALKYSRTKAEPRIEIGSTIDGNHIVYYVRDNGVGFDMTYYGKLFEVFQRLHARDEFEGTGVGLAIVKRIVERHGGRVWAEGTRGEGATFYFALPS